MGTGTGWWHRVGRRWQVDGVQNEHVVIVLGQRNDLPLASQPKSTTSRHLQAGTLEVTDKLFVWVEQTNTKLVSMGVAHHDVTIVGYVNSIGEIGQGTGQTAHKTTMDIVDGHNVALKWGRDKINCDLKKLKKQTLKSQM